MEDFYKKISSTFIDGNTSTADLITARNQSGLMTNEPANRFYQVMANIFNDENSRNELKTFILNGQYGNIQEVTKVVDLAVSGCATLFNLYTDFNKTKYDDIKNNPLYKTLIKSPIEGDIKFGLTYTKVSGTSQQKKNIKELYSNVNVDNKEKTFDGKIKFN